jgi:hypothetical protein
MQRLLLPMLVALVEALAAIGAARVGLRLARRGAEAESRLDRSLSAQLLVGLPLYGTLLYLVGLISTSAIAICASTAPLAVYAATDAIARRLRQGERARARDPFGAAALAAAAIISLLFAQLPAFTLDELAYHLAVPMQWIIGGRVQPFPLISHSWFPFGLESADLFALRLLGHDGAVASHFVHLLCGVALAALLVRRLARESAAPLLFGAAVVTAPALLVIVGWSWNDVPLVGLVAVLYLALEEFVEDARGLATAGLAIAAGLLTKYTFAPVAILLLGAAFTVVDRARRRSLVRSALLGSVTGSFFFARNALMVGNPFEPLITEGTGDVGYRWTGTVLGTIGSYVFDLRILDEALGVSLLVLAFLSVVRAPSRFSLRCCLALLAACAAIAFLTPSARVFLPFLVVPGLVGGLVASRFHPAPRRAIAAILGFAVVAQLTEAALFLSAHRPLALFTGEASEVRWLARRPVTSDVLWIDAALPARSRTLVLGIQELFWFRHEVRGGANNDGARVAAYLQAGDPQRLLERLRSDGITHVAVARGLVVAPSDDFKRRERETLLDEAAMNRLATMLQAHRIVAAKGPLMVFELQ